MRLTLPNLVFVLIVVIAAFWWLLRDNSEAEVRAAHEELIRLIDKSENDDGGISVLEVRALQLLFADPSEISGDPEGLSGSYSPEELVRIVLAIRESFETIELTNSEPVISFPADDDGTAEFTATLLASGAEDVTEQRVVTSRMRRVDGDWQFYRFDLVEGSGP